MAIHIKPVASPSQLNRWGYLGYLHPLSLSWDTLVTKWKKHNRHFITSVWDNDPLSPHSELLIASRVERDRFIYCTTAVSGLCTILTSYTNIQYITTTNTTVIQYHWVRSDLEVYWRVVCYWQIYSSFSRMSDSEWSLSVNVSSWSNISNLSIVSYC